jgi:hypothetical protein
MFLLLVGACSSNPSIPEPIECVPELEVIETIVPVPGELTQVFPPPSVPNSGDNAALLDWAQSCAAVIQQYESQTLKVRELK